MIYLFDGYNLLHAGDFRDARDLRDTLASFVAMKGARGILVFDGVGDDARYGPLEVRYSANADAVLERLAAQHRDTDEVYLISSDLAVRGSSGRIGMLSSALFVKELEPVRSQEPPPASLADKLDPETRARLERLRRGE